MTGPGASARPLRLRIEVAARPDPHLVRAAIAARLAGRPWSGAEAPIADLVAEAVAGRRSAAAPPADGDPTWR